MISKSGEYSTKANNNDHGTYMVEIPKKTKILKALTYILVISISFYRKT